MLSKVFQRSLQTLQVPNLKISKSPQLYTSLHNSPQVSKHPKFYQISANSLFDLPIHSLPHHQREGTGYNPHRSSIFVILAGSPVRTVVVIKMSSFAVLFRSSVSAFIRLLITCIVPKVHSGEGHFSSVQAGLYSPLAETSKKKPCP